MRTHVARQRQLRKLEDLPRLGADLRLLVELDAVEGPVHPQVVVVRPLGAKPLDRLRSRARDRLVRGYADAREPGGVAQRSKDDAQRNGATVRVRDDPAMLERAPSVHLGNDERDALLEPKGGGLVHAERAGRRSRRHELAARFGADREQAHVELAAREPLGRRLLDREAVDRRAGGTGGCERGDVRVPALAQEAERDPADGTGRADDGDPRTGAHEAVSRTK